MLRTGVGDAPMEKSHSFDLNQNSVDEDLGCNGPRLTWTNNRGGTTNTMVRLDRALANESWRLKFSEASVTNIPRTSSDHCPTSLTPNCAKPFKFFASWFEHPDFNSILDNYWSADNYFPSNLTIYKENLIK